MHHDNLDAMFRSAIADCWYSGHRLESRDGGCSEVLGWDGYLDDPRKCFLWNPERRFNPSYAAGELMWYLSGRDDGAFIQHYAPSYSRFLEDDGRANGAYGARWRENGGLTNLVQLLEKTPETRQAVLAMWGPRDLPSALAHDKRDIPCTLSLQFFSRNRKLYLVCTMRSNDAWLGLPNDVFCFCQLQCLVAEYLGLGIGWYRHQVGSIHLYTRNADKAESAMTWHGSIGVDPSVESPFRTGSDRFVAMLQSVCTVENAIRCGSTTVNETSIYFEEAGRCRFVLLAALAACASLRKQSASPIPTVFEKILSKPILEACRLKA